MDWSNILTAVITFLITTALGAFITFVVTTIKGYCKLKKEVAQLVDDKKKLEKNFYKQSLWQVYSSYVEVDREIPEDRYAFAKHCLDEYKNLTGNGTTEFYFEKLDQKYKMQQDAKKEKYVLDELSKPQNKGGEQR